mmetsp:Transcript_39663/g.98879  ORF Transcript_39663/g.98879 Transcript_39663/m.98879 type:complete len:286 (-) Transcript_39663:131-988(-)
MRVSRKSLWSPPKIERAVATLLALPQPHCERGQHFELVTRESGSERSDLPIWASKAGVVHFDANGWGPVQRTDVPEVPGAFVLSNVLTKVECDQLRALSEAMGFTPDAPVSLARNIRRNENCVWIADDSLWRPIWERVAAHMPPPPRGWGPVVGLNQRWRLYRYGVDDIFKMHTDGAWPGSAVDGQGRLVRDIYGDRFSQLTFLIYLDDDYDGGETTFFVPESRSSGQLHSVSVPQGSVLCFWHGEHELSLLHEGSLVTRGVKRIVRSDVLYMLHPTAEAIKSEL